MTNLLNAPERSSIEVFLLQRRFECGESANYERLLGFLSGVVLTPGGLTPSDWLQPLLDFNGIRLDGADDARRLMDLLMPLYQRLNERRLEGTNLCPFDWNNEPEPEKAHRRATEWAMGFNDALKLRPHLWTPDRNVIRQVPAGLFDESRHAVVFLLALAEPESIPQIIPDPLPFQRNLLSKGPGWKDEMLRETWDEELMDMFRVVCLGRLPLTVATLQRYAKAYESGAHFNASAVSGEKARLGRNDPCPCGSGQKYKKCCGR